MIPMILLYHGILIAGLLLQRFLLRRHPFPALALLCGLGVQLCIAVILALPGGKGEMFASALDFCPMASFSTEAWLS